MGQQVNHMGYPVVVVDKAAGLFDGDRAEAMPVQGKPFAGKGTARYRSELASGTAEGCCCLGYTAELRVVRIEVACTQAVETMAVETDYMAEENYLGDSGWTKAVVLSHRLGGMDGLLGPLLFGNWMDILVAIEHWARLAVSDMGMVAIGSCLA